MRQAADYVARTMMETGTVPRQHLREHPGLKRALRLMNRMDAGIGYDLNDLGYRELKMVEIMQGAINKAKQEKMREAEREARSW